MALIRPACPLSPTKLNVFTVNSYLVLFFRRVCMYITNILMKWKTSYVSLFTMYEGGSSLGAGGWGFYDKSAFRVRGNIDPPIPFLLDTHISVKEI